MKRKKKIWSIVFIIILTATIIDLIIPDPLPFVDEVILIATTLFSFVKVLK